MLTLQRIRTPSRPVLACDTTEYDISQGLDLLLILGTSLNIHGFKVIVKEFVQAVHRSGGKVILVNNTNAGKLWSNILDYCIRKTWHRMNLLIRLPHIELSGVKKLRRE
ncbi:Efflux pump dotC [Fusarium oxysporum f. sp. albedinis]|nr:Uncharacterized protein HZ326_26149 [Fusarium oxysporum f. sp. albedinis]KAJ0141216.1 Efflux pump dotC [Fusarium oxysporum f. sp. albedinis]